ncbi:type II secretion system protein GspL [Roseateles paludis]|jgi:general secretion pathway protein L|uniref:Type II secretion system protein GspL n=1 Tax=Roseateles paludis TaxID=3145238 RepID=A0ABV0G4N8_9BURK
MATLLVLLPPRPRLRAQSLNAMAREGDIEFDWLLTPDGRSVSAEGRNLPAALPHADNVVAVMAENDVSWRRVELPKAGRQMRAALAGKLEESLLDEPENLHFALEADATPGDTAWVAITARNWLAELLGQLEGAQIFVDRVVPSAAPDLPPGGHFHDASTDGSCLVELSWTHAEGVASLPIGGSLARQLLSPASVEGTRWTSAPGVVALAERWLGASVPVLGRQGRALAALQTGWNLRQFDLAPKARGTKALWQFLRTFLRPQWRLVRWGLAVLLLLELLGLNLRAWRLQHELTAQQDAINATLSSTFPHVRAILDAPIQMQKELDLLRQRSGALGEQDFETLLAAAATAWPADRGPADILAFEPGRLIFSDQGWSPQQVDALRSQLRSEGWALEASDGRLVISRPTRP